MHTKGHTHAFKQNGTFSTIVSQHRSCMQAILTEQSVEEALKIEQVNYSRADKWKEDKLHKSVFPAVTCQNVSSKKKSL